MAIQPINNNESASSVRTKLNQTIDSVNDTVYTNLTPTPSAIGGLVREPLLIIKL